MSMSSSRCFIHEASPTRPGVVFFPHRPFFSLTVRFFLSSFFPSFHAGAIRRARANGYNVKLFGKDEQSGSRQCIERTLCTVH